MSSKDPRDLCTGVCLTCGLRWVTVRDAPCPVCTARRQISKMMKEQSVLLKHIRPIDLQMAKEEMARYNDRAQTAVADPIKLDLGMKP